LSATLISAKLVYSTGLSIKRIRRCQILNPKFEILNKLIVRSSLPTNHEKSNQLPSLLMGEGVGGGEQLTLLPPHFNPFPPGERRITELFSKPFEIV
jgi:hypothetical protein